jgi:hypothetical protein
LSKINQLCNAFGRHFMRLIWSFPDSLICRTTLNGP